MAFEEAVYRRVREWPVVAPAGSLAEGCAVEGDLASLSDLAMRRVFGSRAAGWWSCDLSDNRLTWTSGVFDLFGLPAAQPVTREEVLGLYEADSRARLERLRAWAIAEASGFAIDVAVQPAAGGPPRTLRILGAPVIDGGAVIRVEGLKLRL